MILQENFDHKILDSSPVWGLTSTPSWGQIEAMFNKWIRPYFQFNRQERWGAVLLIGGLFGLYGLASLFPKRGAVPAPTDQGKSVQVRPYSYDPSPGQSNRKPDLAPFDPNQLSESAWIGMGIPPRTVQTIRNYLEKGGRFRSPEDLGKIWGLKPADRDRLLPYVRIRSEIARPKTFFETKRSGNSSVNSERARSITIDINRSDSVNWEALPGIGPTYARRIVRYRDRLGGFVRLDQIAETYQLPDSVFQQIRPHLILVNPGPIRKIPLYRVSVDTLGRHPYCKFSMARSIVRYREQHGPFRKLEELLDLQQVDSAWWMRMRPYLSLE